jgi:acetyl esterase/lipase
MDGQLLADHWLAVKNGPMPGTEDVTGEAFAELLTQPQEPLSYDHVLLLGDEAPNGDSRRWMLLLLWWQTGQLLDYILGVKNSDLLRSKPFSERTDAVADALHPALLQTQVTSSFPPTILCHGKEDPLILPAESELTYKQLRDLGVEAELHVLNGACYSLMDTQKPQNLAPGAQELREKAAGFLLSKPL